MNKKGKTQRGITLIALVITIIVMLILVGVTISMAVNGGLFNYAGNAVSDTNTKLQEEGKLAEGGIEVDGVKYDTLEDYLNKIPSTGVKIKIGISGTDVEEIPVPEGFTHIETEGTGYVITDEVDENGNSIGNEFVWVPVKQGQKITLNIESETDIKELELYDPYGDLILEVADEDIETTYSNTEIEPTVNGMYMAVTKTEDEETQEEIITQRTLTVKSLYAFDTYNDWLTSDEYAKTLGFNTIEEFALNFLSSKDIPSIEAGLAYFNVPTLEVGMSMISTTMLDFWKDYQDMKDYSTSIEKNGGFYIARYEAGAPIVRSSGNSDHTVEEIITSNGVPVSKEGYAPYNYVSHEQALGLTESMYEENDNYEIALITKAGWDRTAGWILETKAKNLKQVVDRSNKDWGNLRSSEFVLEKGQYYNWEEQTYKDVSEINNKKEKEQMVLLTTGATARNSANNIYDLNGNVFERVNTKIISTGDFCIVGGDYSDTFRFLSYLTYSGINVSNGFRPVIYLK